MATERAAQGQAQTEAQVGAETGKQVDVQRSSAISVSSDESTSRFCFDWSSSNLSSNN